MTLDLETIKARADKVTNFTTKDADPFGAAMIAVDSAEDVPALVAEVERLHTAVADAIGTLDEAEVGDESSVDAARELLWAVYRPEWDPEGEE